MSQTLLNFTDADFDRDVAQNSMPTLVDFWAEWCAPCKALTPVVEEVAQSFAGRVQVGKMNIDDEPQTPGKYAVRAIPTLLLFKDGEVVDQIVGLVTKGKIEEMLTKHVAKAEAQAG